MRAEAQQAQAEAASLKPYRDFAQLSQARLQTVASLAASRFDWDRAVRQVARVLPADAQVNCLRGTVSPQVQLTSDACGSSTSTIRAARTDPALELEGCARSQTEVARVMSRLRLMDGAQRVSLVQSTKEDTATTASPSSNSSTVVTSCPKDRPKYAMVVFFAPLGTPSTVPGSTARVQPVASPPTSADLAPSGSAGATQAVGTGTTP